MIRRFFLIALAIALSPAAQAQTVWTNGARSVTYSSGTEIIGDGGDRVAETFNSTQGGDPPATTSEPAAIGAGSIYTRDDWIATTGIYRIDQGEAKFRIACNYAKSGQFDAIVYPGQTNVGHLHSFAGNINTSGSTTYSSLRNNPASTCDGGPLWSQGYWAPALLYQDPAGFVVEVIPDNHTFYYHEDYSQVAKMIRLLRGAAFIAGVNPADRFNTARLAEIPNGVGWDKSRRYNGWTGWGCFKLMNSDSSTVVVSPDVGNTADPNPQAPDYLRQFKNADGSDPYSGRCEPGSGYKLFTVADLDGPKCFDGYTLQGDGRGQWRYPIRKSDNSVNDRCPDYSWRVPVFEDKIQYSNYGFAWRSRLYLASDRMSSDPAQWQPDGSTMHIDWMYGTDDYVFFVAEQKCMGITINGVAGDPLTCGNGTISPTQRLKGNNEAPPVAGLSNNPIVSLTFKSTGPKKLQYSPVPTGSVVNATISH